jgi:hypothetical protein
MGRPGSDICSCNLDTMLPTCARLGFQWPQESVGPASFLGFELDTEALVVRLPLPKLAQSQRLVHTRELARNSIWKVC